MNESPMIRPFFTHPKTPLLDQVTALICQRKTVEVTKLCLTSLLKWYPTLPILVVDGDSQDESTQWLLQMERLHPNVTVWNRVNNLGGRDSSHGETMHEAIEKHINTPYVLLLDSDTIIDRGGFIEPMVQQMRMSAEAMAIGTIMHVSYANDACGPVQNEADKLEYAHPSCSLYDVRIYLDCGEHFCNHGAPCYRTMKFCRDWDIPVLWFPVEDYVSHLSGHSWQDVVTMWSHDHDVIVRPLFTVFNQPHIVDNCVQNLTVVGEGIERDIVFFDHPQTPMKVKSKYFDMRFQVIGEYVMMKEGMVTQEDIDQAKSAVAINLGYNPTQFELYDRKHWQRHIAPTMI